MPDVEIIDKFDMTNPTNLINARFVGTPPFNEEVLTKLLDYFQSDENIWELSDQELEKRIHKEFMTVVHYAMLYGMEERT